MLLYAQGSLIIAHVDVSSEARDLIFCLSLHLHPYSMYTSYKGSGESEPSLLAAAISTKISCTMHICLGSRPFTSWGTEIRGPRNSRTQLLF